MTSLFVQVLFGSPTHVRHVGSQQPSDSGRNSIGTRTRPPSCVAFLSTNSSGSVFCFPPNIAHFSLCYRSSCLLQKLNEELCELFQNNTNLDDVFSKMNALVMPALAMLQSSSKLQDDHNCVEDVRNQWCSFLSLNTPGDASSTSVLSKYYCNILVEMCHVIL